MFEDAGMKTAIKLKNIIGLDEALKNWIRNTFHTLNDKLPGSLDSINLFLAKIDKYESVEKISQLIIDIKQFLIDSKTPLICILTGFGIIGIIGIIGTITSYFQNKKLLKMQEESLKIQQQLLKIQQQLLKIQQKKNQE
jgi:hypothetical protein